MSTNIVQESGSNVEEALFFVEQDVTRLCPWCGAEILLMGEKEHGREANAYGEEIPCPACAELLEIVKDPDTVRVDTIVEEHDGFRASWLDLSQSPVLVPGPVLQEDHGE